MTNRDPETSERQWGVHDVPAEGTHSVTIGPLTLHLRQAVGELNLRSERVGERRPEPWSRGAVRDWTGQIRLTPVFPIRPLVVQPEEAFWLYREAEARIYVRVPMWVRIEVMTGAHGDIEIERLPTEIFSDTWWGSLEEGELGYHIRTRARRAVTPDLYNHWMCICPLRLRNRSRDDLHVDRIAVRARHLSVFQTETSMWADETLVDYLGEDEGSRLRVVGRAPDEVADAERLVPAEVPLTRGFHARTFRKLKGALSEWF